jgi:hypothetical protein
MWIARQRPGATAPTAATLMRAARLDALERALKDAGLIFRAASSLRAKANPLPGAIFRIGPRPRHADRRTDAANSTAAILGLTSTGQAASSIRLDIRV